MFSEVMTQKVEELYNLCIRHQMVVATAESCTAGMVAALITTIAGSAQIFDGGYITYSNQSKHQMLGLEFELINKHGAVSAEVTQALAEAVLKKSCANISVAVTGFASPLLRSDIDQTGLVHIGVASLADEYIHREYHFKGNRNEIRESAAFHAIMLLIDVIKQLKFL